MQMDHADSTAMGSDDQLIQGRSRYQIEADPRPASGLRLPDDGAECGRRTDPPESDAGDPDNAGGIRRLDARAVG
jgi:hypothetical protein